MPGPGEGGQIKPPPTEKEYDLADLVSLREGPSSGSLSEPSSEIFGFLWFSSGVLHRSSASAVTRQHAIADRLCFVRYRLPVPMSHLWPVALFQDVTARIGGCIHLCCSLGYTVPGHRPRTAVRSLRSPISAGISISP